MPHSLIAPLLQPDPRPRLRPADGMEIAESNHRIANSLALVAGLLRMQATAVARDGRTLGPGACTTLLLEAAGRVDTVGRLHGRLARDAGDIELAEVVREVAEATVGSLATPRQARLSLRLEPGRLACSQQALPVSLAVAELLTNSLKHAHPAGVRVEIEVSCRRESNGDLTIEVADDGVGLPEGFDPMVSNSLGLRLIRALAEQLNAGLAFEDSGIGLAVRLRLPARGAR